MLNRSGNNCRNLANEQRYRLAVLMIGTATFDGFQTSAASFVHDEPNMSLPGKNGCSTGWFGMHTL
jgi:hypothetical protein